MRAKTKARERATLERPSCNERKKSRLWQATTSVAFLSLASHSSPSRLSRFVFSFFAPIRTASHPSSRRVSLFHTLMYTATTATTLIGSIRESFVPYQYFGRWEFSVTRANFVGIETLWICKWTERGCESATKNTHTERRSALRTRSSCLSERACCLTTTTFTMSQPVLLFKYATNRSLMWWHWRQRGWERQTIHPTNHPDENSCNFNAIEKDCNVKSHYLLVLMTHHQHEQTILLRVILTIELIVVVLAPCVSTITSLSTTSRIPSIK